MGETRSRLLVLVLVFAVTDGVVAVSYNTGAKTVPGKLNVHLVAHTHDDLGWLQTPDQYYVGQDDTRPDSIGVPAVQFILHTVIQELLWDPNRTFSYVETGFFIRWWREQTPAKQAIVKQLVASGQLEFLNGGWCLHDEATTHYVDMIDQTTLGHRYLKELFGIKPRHGWQIDPFGHSAVQAYLLSAEAGFDSMFVARIDYQDRAARKDQRALEMIWRGSETFGASSEIFMGVFPVHYSPPSSFEFEVDGRYDPVQDDPRLEGYNINQRVNDLVQQAQQQAYVTRTNHIMWTMGDDFAYQTACGWYSPMDKLIHYANLDGRVNVLYSNPSIYLDAKIAANETWPLKTGDFFPYADNSKSYWTGYFTSRPALKGYVRQMSAYLLTARQLEFLLGRSQESGFNTDALEEAMATVQHHDGVSGTERQAVADDYALHLYAGYVDAEAVINAALNNLTGGSRMNETVLGFQQCGLLNVTYCPPSEAPMGNGTSVVVVAYNSLAWAREEIIRIPVSSDNLTVTDSNGNVVNSQIVPVSDRTKLLRKFYVQANLGVVPRDGPLFDLVFQASVPPLGFNSYTIGEPVSSVTTAAEKSEVDEMVNGTTMQIGNGVLSLTFSAQTGELMSVVNNKIGTGVNVTQTNLWYESYNSDGQGQSSGAYIFLPADDTPRAVSDANSGVSWTVIRGPLVAEVQQVFSPWISQVTRVQKDQEHVEVEFTIGPIPIDDNVGKEVITRLSTSVASNSVFYTDSNGRDFIKRVRDSRDSWNLTVVQPVAGNYYPINLGMYITDGESAFSLLVDRAVGGASIKDGQLEVMLHRRLVADDSRGVDQALNEEVCLDRSDSNTCEGLTIRGRYFISIKSTADAAEWRRSQGQATLAPLLLSFASNEDDSGPWEATHTAQFSAMAPNTSLPANVALITLQELEKGSVLIRFAHLYEANEHPELSKLTTVRLQDLFPTRQIVTATEMSLTANQLKANITKLSWNVEGDNNDTQTKPVRGAPFDSSSLQVELGPMEIRTFILSFKN